MYYITTKAEKTGVLGVPDKYCSISEFGPNYLHVVAPGLDMMVPPSDWHLSWILAYLRAKERCKVKAAKLLEEAGRLKALDATAECDFPLTFVSLQDADEWNG